VGALVLSLLLLPAIFAELMAADAPIFAVGDAGVVVLPAIVTPSVHRGLSRRQIAELHRDDVALWPLVRFGPASVSEDGGAADASVRHPLGTDAEGHDLLARLIYGARTALGLAAAVLVLALLFGTIFGGLAGYRGGIWDDALARPIELIETFPAIVVVAVVRAVDPSGSMWSLVFAVLLVRWAEVARLVRAEVIKVSSEEYVAAARALGCSHMRILRRHILPQAMRPVIVSSLFGVASVVLLEVSVAFLGIGVEGSWGVLLADALEGRAGLHGATWAAIAVGTTVAAAYLLADAMGENLDARVAASSRYQLRHRPSPEVAAATSRIARRA
jgi:peptide/nickel transport system permease protein